MSCAFSLPIFRMSPKMIKKRKNPQLLSNYIELLEKKGKWGPGRFVYIFAIENAFILPTHVDIKLF